MPTLSNPSWTEICGLSGCLRTRSATADLCPGHQVQRRRGKPLTLFVPRKSRKIPFDTCSFGGCVRRVAGRSDLCKGHLAQRKMGIELRELRVLSPRGNSEKLCSFPDCGNTRAVRDYCAGHTAQLRQGRQLAPLKRQVRGGSWNIAPDGYVVKRVGSRGNQTTIFQHREVMSEMLGRPLRKGETVHHKNGVRHDNRPENLELWSRSQPAGQRVEDKLRWAIEMIETYANDPMFRSLGLDGLGPVSRQNGGGDAFALDDLI